MPLDSESLKRLAHLYRILITNILIILLLLNNYAMYRSDTYVSGHTRCCMTYSKPKRNVLGRWDVSKTGT